MSLDPQQLAQEIAAAHTAGRAIEQRPSDRAAFELPDAYRVVDRLAGLRREQGASLVGRKIGFTNKATWPKLNVDTIVWGYVFSDTVHYFSANRGEFSLAHTVAPRIEPEIVFKLRQALPANTAGPQAALEAVEWLALGFEIVDCPYPNWQFRPADMVAAYGFHSALLVGEPRPPGDLDELAGHLAAFRLRLLKNGEVAAQGQGSNVYDSPARCLAQLAHITGRQPEAGPLAAGEVITSGTVTDAMPIAPGQQWAAEVEGLDLPRLEVTFK